MHFWKKYGITVAGICAGAVSGLLGAGGGMVLIPLLRSTDALSEEALFPASVCMILPICIVSLVMTYTRGVLSLREIYPWLLGSGIGGILSGIWGKRIPVVWLHRILGVLILWGGVQKLC